MRDNIIKKRVRADEVINKVPTVSRELQKLQQSNGIEPVQDESADWHTNDLSGDYQNDSYTCPSCFKKFDRKAVYTSHVQACSDAICREKDKSKKRKAKEETKLKQLLEFEEASNASENSAETPVIPPVAEVPDVVNKRKRKKVTKVKKDEVEAKANMIVQKEDSDSVDWNLDDEEEKKKLDNIKKEIIEDEYKRVNDVSAGTSTASTSKALPEPEPMQDDDEEESALVIDEKPVGGEASDAPMKCPQCEKVFEGQEKLTFHLNTYHSRQKRFKCKMCEYQGYRKKDTINHLDYVHKINADKDKLEQYMESVMKAVDEESLSKQNELKKAQLKIKRKLAREKQKLNGSKDESGSSPVKAEASEAPSSSQESTQKSESESPKKDPPSLEAKMEFKEPEVKSEFSAPKAPKVRRKSLHTSILIPPETDSTDDVMKIPKMFIKASPDNVEEKKKRRKHESRSESSSPKAGQSLLSISKFGKIVKRSSSGDPKDNSARPIRNRIKPVRKDFLYDLSDLLKKDADAYREQAIQSTTVGYKRQLRQRAMSTCTREIPGLNSFDDLSPDSTQQFLLGPPSVPVSKDEDDIPLVKLKDPRHRRMSVFNPPTRPMFPTGPRPVGRPPNEPSHNKPNSGAAYRMALNEFNANRASLYEPKFLWSVCFDRAPKRASFSAPAFVAPAATSAATSILQKLSAKLDSPFKDSHIPKSPIAMDDKFMSTEQAFQGYELPSATDFDLPDSRAVNLNPTGNGLVALALEEAGKDICVLQECDPDSDDEFEDETSEKPSSSSATVSDAEPKRVPVTKRTEGKTKRSKRSSDKRKSGANGQRRLTVMQRLQENKIRKSREQLFKRLIMDRQNEDENPSSPVYNLFSES